MNRELVIFLVVINLIASIEGFRIYYPDVISKPFYLWILVPDCPLAALLFAVAIGFRKEKKRWWQILAVITFTALIKYSVWTWSVYLEQPAYYFTPESWQTVSFNMFLHAIMFAEAFLLIRKTKVAWYAVSCLFLLQDLSDYFITLPPTKIPLLNKNLIEGVTIVLSVALPYLYTRLGRCNKRIYKFFSSN